jgi:hypothetical protein
MRIILLARLVKPKEDFHAIRYTNDMERAKRSQYRLLFLYTTL